MYLYTDVIEFAPFGSNKNRRSRSAEIVTLSGDKVPRPSPKSIYRLADKVCDCAFAILVEHPTSDSFPAVLCPRAEDPGLESHSQ